MKSCGAAEMCQPTHIIQQTYKSFHIIMLTYFSEDYNNDAKMVILFNNMNNYEIAISVRIIANIFKSVQP